jgi:hypothetical protein
MRHWLSICVIEHVDEGASMSSIETINWYGVANSARIAPLGGAGHQNAAHRATETTPHGGRE